MSTSRERVLEIWNRTISLGGPIAVQQMLNTLMRTVDIIVTGIFSPAAVAAVGLSDLYAQVVMRISHALGAGAIALSSQDTGRGALASRDRAMTQAMLVGFLCGIPIVIVGVLFGHVFIAVLGAESRVVTLGGVYLSIILAVAPMRIVGLVGARCLQGTGDTRTPMYVNGSANLINIVLTIGLGLGISAFPELGIVGVGVATAVSRTYEAVAIIAVIASDRTQLSFIYPWNTSITRQLIEVSVPKFAEGMSTSIVSFPFNALLLLFGTEVSAAFHIARRVFHQIAGPLYRSFGTVTSIIVGQTLGETDEDGARFAGRAILGLSLLTLGSTAIVLISSAEELARLFTQDRATAEYATTFVRVYGVSMVFFGIFYTFAGVLQGAGDTRTPFYARFVGEFGFMLGFSYGAGLLLGFGLPGVYLGMILTHVCRATIASYGFYYGNWTDKAAAMIAERTEAMKKV